MHIARIARGCRAATARAEDKDAGHKDRDNAENAAGQHSGHGYVDASRGADGTGVQAIAGPWRSRHPVGREAVDVAVYITPDCRLHTGAGRHRRQVAEQLQCGRVGPYVCLAPRARLHVLLNGPPVIERSF